MFKIRGSLLVFIVHAPRSQDPPFLFLKLNHECGSAARRFWPVYTITNYSVQRTVHIHREVRGGAVRGRPVPSPDDATLSRDTDETDGLVPTATRERVTCASLCRHAYKRLKF